MFRLLRVFRPFRYNHTILLCVRLSSLMRLKADNIPRTIEVMYLSVRRSQHALLAIGFFVVMILTVFSTLLYVLLFSSRPRTDTSGLQYSRYFAERGTWDEALDAFINVDGDPTQFAVRLAPLCRLAGYSPLLRRAVHSCRGVVRHREYVLRFAFCPSRASYSITSS